MLTAGQIEYVISVNTQDLINMRAELTALRASVDANLTASANQFDDFSAKVSDVAKAIASFVAINETRQMILETSAAIDVNKKFADSIGASFEQLQRLQYAAGQSGVEVDVLNNSLRVTTRQFELAGQGAAPDFIENLDKIGVSIADIQNLRPEQQFIAVADAISRLGTDSQRTAAAFTIFEDEGQAMTNLFRLGGDGILNLGRQLDTLGGVISTKTASDFEAFNDHLDNMNKSIEGLKVQVIASFSEEMLGLSSAMSEFVKDGEKVNMVMKGIGIAAMTTGAVLVGRLVGGLAAASVGMSAAAVAASGLRVALAFLGGPIGIAVSLALALGGVAYAMDDTKDSAKSLVIETDKLRASISGLSESQMKKGLEDDTKSLEEAAAKVRELEAAVSNLKKSGGGQGDFIKGLEQSNNALSDMADAVYKLDSLKASVKVRLEVYNNEKSKREIKESIAEISRSFDESGAGDIAAKISALASSLDMNKLMGIDRIEASRAKALEEVSKYYEEFPVIAQTYMEAEAKIVDAYNKEAAKAAGDESRLVIIRSIRDKELKEAKAFYDKNGSLLITELEIRNKIMAEYDKQALAEKEKSNKEFQAIEDRLLGIISSNNEAHMSELSRINLAEKKALAETADILSQYPSLEEVAAKSVIAIKARAAADRKSINERTLAEEKTYRDQLLSLISSFDSDLDTEEDNAISDRDSRVKQLDELRGKNVVSEEQYAAQIIAINERLSRDLATIAADRLAKEKETADNLAKKREENLAKMNDANNNFSDFAGKFKHLSPMEALIEDERTALEKLKQLWEEKQGTQEEYLTAELEMQKFFKQERDWLREDEAAATQAAYAAIAGSAGAIFGTIADAIKSGSDEASGAYKAFFLLSKAFAIAQAGINLNLAITQAMAAGPYPANLIAMSSVAAAGASFISSIGSAVFTGRQNGGDVSRGNMYKVNENGPEIYSYGNEDYLMGTSNAKVTPMSKMGGGDGGSGVNVTVNNMSSGVSATASQGLTKNDVIIMIKDIVPSEISNPNSKTSRELSKSTSANRRIT